MFRCISLIGLQQQRWIADISTSLPTFSNFCQQIKEQQATLQQIQAHFQLTSALPFNYIHPNIKLLLDLKAFLPRMIHMNERDTMRMARQDLIIRKPHLASQINCAWCCRCHSPTCIYDWLLVLCAFPFCLSLHPVFPYMCFMYFFMPHIPLCIDIVQITCVYYHDLCSLLYTLHFKQYYFITLWILYGCNSTLPLQNVLICRL